MVGVASLGMCGCSTFVSSVSFNQRLLVKVRSDLRPDEMVPRASATDPGKSDPEAWHFRHVVEAPRDPENHGDWYVGWRDNDLKETQALSLSQLLWGRWRQARERAPSLARATHEAFGVYPLMIEPNLVFSGTTATHPSKDKPALSVSGQPLANPEEHAGQSEVSISAGLGNDYIAVWYHDRKGKRRGNTAIAKIQIGSGVTAAWPTPNEGSSHSGYGPEWHQDADYSQLADARAAVAGGHRGPGTVRIGILDTGYDRQHVAKPLYLEDSWRGDADGWTHGWGKNQLWSPGRSKERGDGSDPTHGMGTIGILAGRQAVFAPDPSAKGQEVVSVPKHPVWVGGAPNATVVPVRVAANPVSLGTAALAYGIDYASRVKGCDVISMSHGGSPTQAWVDAVNAAYERGTAMFAAEGDFFSLAPYGLRPGGIVVSSSPVYPAAFRRVVGVTGATAEKRSYSGNSLARLFRRLDLITTWVFRGSYGPDGWLGGIDPRVGVDDEEKKAGALRSYPIAGYTPNIAWLAETQGVDMDGSGTSASTPQVAAAAALWLERNRRAIGPQWHSWQKAEAVYDALLISAQRQNSRDEPDLYLGAGMLKANRALQWDYARVRGLRSDALKFAPMVKDEFGGAESFWRLLFRAPAHVPASDRAQLNQTDIPGETKENALARMYYNMLLLEKWHGGAIPRHGRDERGLIEKGTALAHQTMASAGPH
jgi:hypothetical protein